MPDLFTEANRVAQALAKQYAPEKIILFGSAARGDYHTNSDIDLLIIKKSTKKKAQRAKEVFELLRTIPRTYSLDPLVYTPEEIGQRLAVGDYFVKRIMTEGKVLYG